MTSRGAKPLLLWVTQVVLLLYAVAVAVFGIQYAVSRSPTTVLMAGLLLLYVGVIVAVQRRSRWGRIAAILILVFNGVLIFAASGTASVGGLVHAGVLVALAMAISFNDSVRAYFESQAT